MSLYYDLSQLHRQLKHIHARVGDGRLYPKHSIQSDLDDCLADIESLMDNLEPTEEEQGLIPIPAGYAEQ